MSKAAGSKQRNGEIEVRERAREIAASLRYSTGFGNEHASEAVPGALPVGRNSPHQPPKGLYIELFTETAFSELRANTRRSWLYRMRPSVASPRYERIDSGTLRSPPFTEVPIEPNPLYWDPRPPPAAGTDFVSGLWTVGGNGDPAQRTGVGIHLYTADTSMTDRVFSTSDGELLIVPELGGLLIRTELGLLSVEPGEIALIPRSHKFRVEIQGASQGEFVRGYVFENFGRPFVLPELGFMGQSGMANPRDFRAPTPAYDDVVDRAVEVIQKVGGNLWRAVYHHSPLDVVAWHGNSVPYVYNLYQFQVLGSVNFDHPDPSRYTVLTSPTAVPGVGNLDFCAVPPEWQITEETMRLQYFHRNISAEFYGVIKQSAAPSGWVQGMAEVVNMLVPHGPDASIWEAAVVAELVPFKTDHLLIVAETQLPIALTKQARQVVGTTDDETLKGHNTLPNNFSPTK